MAPKENKNAVGSQGNRSGSRYKGGRPPERYLKLDLGKERIKALRTLATAEGLTPAALVEQWIAERLAPPPAVGDGADTKKEER